MIGTLQLLAACQRTETLGSLVVRGSAAIYGCEGASPSFFTEEMARRLPLRTRFQRDASELEAYVDNFARRHPGHRLLHAALPAGDRRRGSMRRWPGTSACRSSRPSSASTPAFSCFTPTTPPARSRRRSRNPVRGAVNVAPRRSDLAEPLLRLCATAVGADSASAVRAGVGAAWKLARGRPLYGDGVRFLRFGRGVDNRRLRTEIGYRAEVRRGGGGARLREQDLPAVGWALRCTRADLGASRWGWVSAYARRAESGRERSASTLPAPRRWRTSCAGCGAGIEGGSIR